MNYELFILESVFSIAMAFWGGIYPSIQHIPICIYGVAASFISTISVAIEKVSYQMMKGAPR